MKTKLNNTLVRPPDTGDLFQVQQLRHEVLDPQHKTPTELELSEHDYDPEYVHMAAYEDSKIVSTVRLNPLKSDRRSYLVRKMATSEAYRGRGIGGQVLHMAEQVAIKRGAESFILDSRKEAIPFYEKNGYSTTGEKVMHDDGVTNYAMIKQVKHGN